MLIVGKLYTIIGSRSLSPRKYLGREKQYCQLHGEFIGYQHLFIKKRNSIKTPWGSCTEVYGDDVQVEPYEQTTGKPNQGGKDEHYKRSSDIQVKSSRNS